MDPGSVARSTGGISAELYSWKSAKLTKTHSKFSVTDFVHTGPSNGSQPPLYNHLILSQHSYSGTDLPASSDDQLACVEQRCQKLTLDAGHNLDLDAAVV